MNKVFVNNQLVFEGHIQKIGGGGTKSAYSLIGTDKVILVPNEVDGLWLKQEFDRIRREELTMYQYLKSKSIPSLQIELCDVFLSNGTYIKGIYSPSFKSYIDRGAYIIDMKDILSCCWDKNIIFNSSFFELESWIPIFTPLIDDLRKASENGLSLIPYYDNFNMMITKKGSEYHIGEAEYAVRFFGFDFSSKRSKNQIIEKIQTGEQLEKVEFSLDLNAIVDNVFWSILENITQEIKEFKSRLISYLETTI